MSIYLRPGEFTDLPAIAALLVDTWQFCYRDFLPAAILDEIRTEQQLSRHEKLFQNGAQYLVAETEDGQLTGFASFGPPRFEALATNCELYTLYVDHHYQHTGIGSRLLDAVYRAVPGSCNSLLVMVMEDNPYRSFYEKKGFLSIGGDDMEIGGMKIHNVLYRRGLPRPGRVIAI